MHGQPHIKFLATPSCVVIVDIFILSDRNVCAKIIHYTINKHDYMWQK